MLRMLSYTAFLFAGQVPSPKSELLQEYLKVPSGVREQVAQEIDTQVERSALPWNAYRETIKEDDVFRLASQLGPDVTAYQQWKAKHEAEGNAVFESSFLDQWAASPQLSRYWVTAPEPWQLVRDWPPLETATDPLPVLLLRGADGQSFLPQGMSYATFAKELDALDRRTFSAATVVHPLDRQHDPSRAAESLLDVVQNACKSAGIGFVTNQAASKVMVVSSLKGLTHRAYIDACCTAAGWELLYGRDDGISEKHTRYISFGDVIEYGREHGITNGTAILTGLVDAARELQRKTIVIVRPGARTGGQQ